MKETDQVSSDGAEQAIALVLKAEQDAERAVHDCEEEARQIINDAQVSAQRILARADERITNMEMRHSHKLDRMVKEIEREGSEQLRLDASQDYDESRMKQIIGALVIDLCCADSVTGDGSDEG